MILASLIGIGQSSGSGRCDTLNSRTEDREKYWSRERGALHDDARTTRTREHVTYRGSIWLVGVMMIRDWVIDAVL